MALRPPSAYASGEARGPPSRPPASDLALTLARRFRAQRVVDEIEVSEQARDQTDLDDLAFAEVRA